MSKACDLANVATRSADLKAGTTAFFAMNAAPTGWLKANGAAVSRTTYADLFAAIGTTFGAGDGSTTFALPDLRGEFPRGWDDSRGVDSGRSFGSAQSHAVQSHTHDTSLPSRAGSNWNTSRPAAWGGDDAVSPGGNKIATTTAAGGAETRPRNVALLACIKF